MISRAEACSPASVYNFLASRVELLRSNLLRLKDTANNVIFSEISDYQTKLKSLKISMDSLYPLEILKNGYAAVQDDAGKWITSAKSLSKGKEIVILFNDGKVQAKVEKVVLNET